MEVAEHNPVEAAGGMDSVDMDSGAVAEHTLVEAAEHNPVEVHNPVEAAEHNPVEVAYIVVHFESEA